MSWATLATVFAALNGGYNFLMSLFGKKKDATAGGIEDANTVAVATENKIGKTTAEVSRTTQQDIDRETQVANDVAADRHSQLAAASGLRARAQVLDATRDAGGDRSDPSTGAHG